MKFILRLVLIIGITMSALACPSRKEALDCFYKIGDQNNDGRVTETELEAVLWDHLNWIEWGGFRLFGGMDRIMADCDTGGNRILTRAGADIKAETCLETCFKRSKTIEVFGCDH